MRAAHSGRARAPPHALPWQDSRYQRAAAKARAMSGCRHEPHTRLRNDNATRHADFSSRDFCWAGNLMTKEFGSMHARRASAVKRGRDNSPSGYLKSCHTPYSSMAQVMPAWPPIIDAAKQVSLAARNLSVSDRPGLVEQLLDTLDAPDQSTDRQWAAEAEERLEAYRRGEIEAVPLAAVLAKHASS